MKNKFTYRRVNGVQFERWLDDNEWSLLWRWWRNRLTLRIHVSSIVFSIILWGVWWPAWVRQQSTCCSTFHTIASTRHCCRLHFRFYQLLYLNKRILQLFYFSYKKTYKRNRWDKCKIELAVWKGRGCFVEYWRAHTKIIFSCVILIWIWEF